MKKCEECGKDLRLLEGYQHPTLGKKHLVCSPCFDQVSESVEKWSEFVLSNNIKNVSYDSNTKFDWKKIAPSITKIRNIFESEWTEKEIDLER